MLETEIKKLTDAVTKLSALLEANAATVVAEPKPEPKPDPTVEKVTESEPKNPETVHTMDDLKASFTMDDLKASLTALAKSKGAKAPKEFLQSRGYSKLSEVPESEIDSLMAEVA